MGWRGRRFPNNETSARTVLRGPNPISAATQPIIDLVLNANMIIPTRELRVGEKNTLKFTGDGGDKIQRWRGLTGAGAAMVRPGFNQALPATNAPAGAQSAVLRAMALNGTVRA